MSMKTNNSPQSSARVSSPALVISSHVINTLNSLPENERVAVTSALAAELILGEDVAGAGLTPMQLMLYSMIKSYVKRDTYRFTHNSGKVSDSVPFQQGYQRAAAI